MNVIKHDLLQILNPRTRHQCIHTDVTNYVSISVLHGFYNNLSHLFNFVFLKNGCCSNLKYATDWL